MGLFKSRKTYYLYNPNTLSYERVYPSTKDRVFAVLRHLSTGVIFVVVTLVVIFYFFDSPGESRLRKENRLLQTQYEVLSLRLNEALEVLDDIQQRDETLYRTIFQAESIPESVRKSGFGGANRYEHLMSLSNADLVVSTTKKMDMLRKQLYIESNSLDELISLGKNQEERSKCIPAIQPIANKDLRRTASGYGMRIDPIYRTPRFHSGMDFSFDLLRKNSELPDVFSGGPVERQPVAEAEIPIADAVPVDPLPHLVVGEGAFPGIHDLGILKHGAEQGKVLPCHFPQDQPGGFCDDPAARDGW